MFYKNEPLAFDKLNSCLQDVQELILSSIFKLNPNETFWLSFSSQEIGLSPPFQDLGKFMHPSVTVNLFIYLFGVLCHCQHCIRHIISQVVGEEDQRKPVHTVGQGSVL